MSSCHMNTLALRKKCSHARIYSKSAAHGHPGKRRHSSPSAPVSQHATAARAAPGRRAWMQAGGARLDLGSVQSSCRPRLSAINSVQDAILSIGVRVQQRLHDDMVVHSACRLGVVLRAAQPAASVRRRRRAHQQRLRGRAVAAQTSSHSCAWAACGASRARAWRLGLIALLVARRELCITGLAWLLCGGARRADPVEQRQ